MNSRDHGILNLPLAKRGNIDAQLDAYKAAEAAKAASQRKAAAIANREAKAAAKVALAELKSAPGVLDQRAANFKITRANLCTILTDWSKWEPAKLLKAHAEWMPA